VPDVLLNFRRRFINLGFLKKLGKVVKGIDQLAPVAAGVLPGKAGQVAGGVAQGAGVVTSIVQQLQSKSGADISPEEAQQKAALTTAVAVDDHEERLKALEAELAALRAAQGGQTGQAGQSGQSGASGQSGGSGQTGTSGPSDASRES
jgi:hypothetical protein